MTRLLPTIALVLFAGGCGAVQQSAPTPRRVVFIGDSITAQWDLAVYFPGQNYINKGVGGNTSAMVLARFDADAISERPDTIVILVGLNDINQNISLSETQANISSMVAKARQAGIRVILCTVLPIGPPIDPLIVALHNQEIVVMDGWIRAQSNAIADYYSAIQVNGVLPQSLSIDGGHPNADGYKVLSGVISAII